MSELTAFPLCWPDGWPRTEVVRRESAPFKAELGRALAGLRDQVRLMGGKDLLLSSNCALGDERPRDCGVVAYFKWQETAMAIPCDRWNRVADNVRAIALTIEAMRGMERWGAKHMIKAMFTGFKRLPERASGVPWWELLGVRHDAPMDKIKLAYRERAKEFHPDRGGDAGAMARLNEAFSLATEHAEANGRAH